MRFVRKTLKLAAWAFGAGGVILGGIVKVGKVPDWWSPESKVALAWIVANQWWLLPGVPLLAFFLAWTTSWMERSEAVARREAAFRRVLGRMLETLRPEFILSRLSGDPETFHRLTIFKANRKQTELRIVARSTEATSGSATRWRIHPDREGECEGVAGVAWFRNCMLTIANLPDVTKCEADDANIRQYAERTYVSQQNVREQRWCARSYAALGLRTADGRRWGVLVLDSMDPEGANDRIVKGMGFTPELLSHIIEWGES